MSSEVIVLLQGSKITPFERPWSTTTKMESCPSAGGRSVIKSMEQLAKGRSDRAPSVGMKAGFEGDRSILNCWQMPQPHIGASHCADLFDSRGRHTVPKYSDSRNSGNPGMPYYIGMAIRNGLYRGRIFFRHFFGPLAQSGKYSFDTFLTSGSVDI